MSGVSAWTATLAKLNPKGGVGGLWYTDCVLATMARTKSSALTIDRGAYSWSLLHSVDIKGYYRSMTSRQASPPDL